LLHAITVQYRKWSDQEYGKGGQPLVLVMIDLQIEYTAWFRCGNEKQAAACFEMTLMEV